MLQLIKGMQHTAVDAMCTDHSPGSCTMPCYCIHTQVHADVVTADVAIKCLSNILTQHLNSSNNSNDDGDDSTAASKKSSSSSNSTSHKKKAKTTHSTSSSTASKATASTNHDDKTIALLTKVSLLNITKTSVYAYMQSDSSLL
jgi:hypothetical protein